MKKLLIILLALTGSISAMKAEALPADSALNMLTMASAEDTLIYYPATAFAGIPTLLYTDGIDSTMITPELSFEDCQLAYTWVPAASGITLQDMFPVQLMVYERGAEYELRYTQKDPMGCTQTLVRPSATKQLRGGQIVIIRDNQAYNLLGNKH